MQQQGQAGQQLGQQLTAEGDPTGLLLLQQLERTASSSGASQRRWRAVARWVVLPLVWPSLWRLVWCEVQAAVMPRHTQA
jgi:hypothetical protein